MRVLVAGATGAVGRPLVRRLTEAGHEVVGLARPGRADAVAATGATPAVADLLDRDGVAAAVATARPEVVVHEATSLPSSLLGPLAAWRGMRVTSRLREAGTANLVAAAERAGARRVVAQSIAFGYRPGPGVRTEDDPLWVEAPSLLGRLHRALAALERTVAASPLESVVLRYGSFYGPGTYYAADGDFVRLIRWRLLPLVGDGTSPYGFVHVDDAAAATVAALDGPVGTYNVVEDEPAPAGEWVGLVAAAVGARPPRRVPRRLVAVGPARVVAHLLADQSPVSNQRARELLGWRPAHAWRTDLLADRRP